MKFDVTELQRITQPQNNTEATEQAVGVDNAADKDASSKPFYATQDETSLYEEYLFGRTTYAQGKGNKTWSDSTKGRTAMRLASRGIFGALAFTWGGRVSVRQLQNYSPETFRFSVKSVRHRPLQALAKVIDTVAGAPIKAGVKAVAPKDKAEQIANRAVRFRQKNYYHDNNGESAGRSLGAEVVAITFDFASASTADATMRSVIQLADPNVEKPWKDQDGNTNIGKATKEFTRTAWRIFSKNQGEDWAAALPYVYQMKFQRSAIAKVKMGGRKLFPGFKLTSDVNISGASKIINRSGEIVGDYYKAGALDYQLRFMGYNWYTLMYREAYDNIRDGWTRWRSGELTKDDFALSNPISATVTNAAHAARYVVKSAVKSGLYMLPSVPFFWMFRVPQTSWRAPVVVEQEKLIPTYNGKEIPTNAYLMRKNVNYNKHVSEDFAYDAIEMSAKTADDNTRVWAGGKHTNGGKLVHEGYYTTIAADRLDAAEGLSGSRLVNQKTKTAELGGDAAYKWKNQKSFFSKILNPFGWVSYKTGSALVNAADAMAKTGRFGRMLSGSGFDREMFIRGAVDASFSYTPYMVAKTEFGLRVDDRGAGRELGEMDKAIYKGIDSFVTFDMKGLGHATNQIGQLLFNRHNVDEKPKYNFDEGADLETPETPKIPERAAAPKATIQAQTASIPALKTNTKHALSHPQIQPLQSAVSWEEKLKSGPEKQTFLYPESRTIQ